MKIVGGSITTLGFGDINEMGQDLGVQCLGASDQLLNGMVLRKLDRAAND
jgi:hypothetical protein